ncbi:MAG: hypothetical protein AAF703_12350 [Cyanobacteria bacterium P01_D01_bin.105]
MVAVPLYVWFYELELLLFDEISLEYSETEAVITYLRDFDLCA